MPKQTVRHPSSAAEREMKGRLNAAILYKRHGDPKDAYDEAIELVRLLSKEGILDNDFLEDAGRG